MRSCDSPVFVSLVEVAPKEVLDLGKEEEGFVKLMDKTFNEIFTIIEDFDHIIDSLKYVYS